MEKLTVLKPFNTPLRRFALGDVIAATDVDGVMTASDWESAGFLEAETKQIKAQPRRAAATPNATESKGEKK